MKNLYIKKENKIILLKKKKKYHVFINDDHE